MKKRGGGGAAPPPKEKAKTKGQMELQSTIEDLMKQVFIKEIDTAGSSTTSGADTGSGVSESEPQQKKCLPSIQLSKVPGRPGEEFKLLALNNDLIWKNITQYLTHNELKKTSLVCKNFFQRIRRYKRFQNSSVVRLQGGDFLCSHFTNYADDVSLIWKSIEIVIDLPLNLFISHNKSAARKRFRHAESMKITVWSLSTILEMHGPFLKIVLAATTPNLKSLTLHCVLLGHRYLQATLDDPLVRAVIQNLDELHISTGRNRIGIGTIFDSTELTAGGQALEFNLKKLESLTSQLKSFSWGRIDISPKAALPKTVYALHLVKKSANTLTCLTLELYPWCIDFITEIVCPNLQNLKIFARCKNYENVVAFLEKQPPLVTLDLEIYDEMLPLEVTEAVEIVHATSLKKFRLKCDDVMEEPAVLRMLSRMNQLEACDLQIAQYDTHTNDEFSTACVLKALPKTISQLTLRRLCSGGMDVICDHVCPECPAFQDCECEPMFKCQCLPRPQAENNIARLQLFVNLTELTIINRSVQVDYDLSMSDYDDDSDDENDESMIDDKMLQFIIENLKKLKVLRFAHCWNLTNFGLTGCLPNGQRTGTAINALSDLRELVMKDCPLLSDSAVLSVLKFQRLTTLYMIIREPVNSSHHNLPSKKTLVQIVKQNPCLSSITIHSGIANIEKTLKTANPSLVNVFNAHTQECGSGTIDGDKNYFNDPYEDYMNFDEYGYTTSEETDDDEEEFDYLILD